MRLVQVLFIGVLVRTDTTLPFVIDAWYYYIIELNNKFMDIWQILFDWLTKTFPQYWGFFVVLIVVIVLTIWCVNNYNKIKDVCKEFPTIKDSLNRIDKSLGVLNSLLIENNIIKNSFYSEAHSPRQLNELGRKLYSESGAEALFNSMVNELLSDLEKKKPLSFLDVETESFVIMFDHTEDIRLKELKDFAYNHPNFEGNNLTFSDLLYVMSINLRNKYLEMHSEIKSNEAVTKK